MSASRGIADLTGQIIALLVPVWFKIFDCVSHTMNQCRHKLSHSTVFMPDPMHGEQEPPLKTVITCFVAIL